MAWYKHPVFVCIVACIIPNIGGFLGSLTTQTGEGSWYQSLAKPSWNPPTWLFFPAWTTLYILMGFASFRIWYKGGGFTGRAKIPLIFFAIQLILNWIYSPVLFGLESLGGALIIIIILWLFIVATTYLFFRIDLIGGLCMLPYIAWVSFATALNYALWDMN